MTLARFLITLRARWATALAVLLIVLGATTLLSLLMPTQYTATAMVLVDAKAADPLVTNPQQPVQAATYLATQVDLLQSERVAKEVIRRMGLNRDPQDALHQQWRSKTGGQGDFESWLSALMKKNLDVRPTKESGIISVGYIANDRTVAADMANAFVQAYIDTSLALRLDPALSSNTFFDERAGQLRQALEQAQHRLSEFQRAHGLLSIGSDERIDIETARLNELSSQLVTLQGQVGESGSRQSQARANPEKAPEVISNPVVSNLTAELLRQEAKLQELGTRLGDNHPAMQEQKTTVAQLRSQLSAEARRVAASLGINDAVNQQRAAQVKTALEAQRTKVLELTTYRDEARVLQRDVQNAQTAYDAIAGRITQSATDSQAKLSNVAVLKRATPPAKPSSPQLDLNLMVAALLGSLLALAVVLGLELHNRRLRCADDVEELLDVPLLVEIPPVRPGRAVRQPMPALGQLATATTSRRLPG